MSVSSRLTTSLTEPAWPLLISTVPAGAADVYADRIRAGTFAAAAVLDVIYHPWPTRLAEAAAAAGAAVSGGFELLLHQAARQVELMTGQDAPTARHARGRPGRAGPPDRVRLARVRPARPGRTARSADGRLSARPPVQPGSGHIGVSGGEPDAAGIPAGGHMR